MRLILLFLSIFIFYSNVEARNAYFKYTTLPELVDHWIKYFRFSLNKKVNVIINNYLPDTFKIYIFVLQIE